MVAAGRPGHQRWRAIRIVGGLLPSNVSFRFRDSGFRPSEKGNRLSVYALVLSESQNLAEAKELLLQKIFNL